MRHVGGPRRSQPGQGPRAWAGAGFARLAVCSWPWRSSSSVVRNLGFLVLALVGLGVAVGGMWWAVTERMPRRGLGIAGGIVGVILMVLAIIWVTPHSDRPLLRLALVAVLLVAAVGFGRAALVRDLHEHDDRRPVSVKRPQHPVLICNPWSGGGKVASSVLPTWPRISGSRWSCSIMASTSNSWHGMPSPAGPTVWAWPEGMALRPSSPPSPSSTTFRSFAFRPARETTSLWISGSTGRILASASMPFVTASNAASTTPPWETDSSSTMCPSASMPRSCSRRDTARPSRRPPRRMLPEMLGRTQEPFDLQFTEPSGVRGGRCLLDPGVQQSLRPRRDPRCVSTPAAGHRKARDRCHLGKVGERGGPGRSPSRHWANAAGAGTGTSSPPPTSRSGLGPARPTPASTVRRWNSRHRLEFQIHPRGLRLLVPEGNLTAAERRRARDISVGDLVAIARGIDPLAAV